MFPDTLPLINTLPLLSAKKPALVVAVVVASATLPTFIVPADANWTFPPVSVEAAIVQPPISPPVNWTNEPVICPLSLRLNAPFELEISDSLSVNPPISPPLNNTFEPVTSPLALTWKKEDDINKFCAPPCVGIPAAEPDM